MAKNTVRVNVVGDASSFKQAMGEVQKSTDLVEKGMKKLKQLAYTALVLGALKAVKDFVGDSKRAFVDLNESLNAVQVTYGKHAEGIKQLGKEAATGLGLSNAEFNSFAVSISAFAKQIAGDSGDVVGTVKDLTGRVSDFASVMNLEVAEAARLFQSGLAGESEPLRKYGIDVSAATVKTFAYANGIAKTGEELTEAQKVQARYGSIMAQTAQVQGDFTNTSGELANATRIANAQMENSKAIIGQALKGAYESVLPLQVELAKTAARLAISFMELTGQITELEAETLRLNEATDGGAENLKEMADALAFTTEATRDHKSGQMEDTEVQKDFEDILKSVNRQLIAQPDFLDLAEKSAQELRHEAEELGRQYGWTEDQIKKFVDMLLFQQKVQSDTGSGDAWLDSLLNQGEAVEELAEETGEATTALQDFESQVRSQTDPLFNLVAKTDELAEATAGVSAAVEEYGEGSAEHREALRKEYLAWEALKAAQIRAAEQSGLTMEEFKGDLKATQLFTDAEIDLIIADFERVNAFKFSGKTITVEVQGGGGISKMLAKGGPVKKGEAVIVGEEGPEVFQPNQSGQIIPNGSNGGSPLGGGGGGITVIVQGSVLTEQDLVDAIHEGLLKKQKRNGGLGLAG